MSKLWRRQHRRPEQRFGRSQIVTTDPPKKVAVCTPAGDMVHTEYASSKDHMLMYSFGTQDPRLGNLAIYTYGSSILPFSRQMLAQMALDQGATHLLWIDSDMAFPRDLIHRFLGHTEPIVGINAMSRRPPHNNTAQSAPGVQIETRPESTGTEKVYRVGFGVAWIAAEVFKAIEPPWFEFEWSSELKCYRGEDYVFCERAAKAGFECVIDHDISKLVMHVGHFGYNPLLKTMMPQEVKADEAT